MITKEPRLRVGIMEGKAEISGCLNGNFRSPQYPGQHYSGNFTIHSLGGEILFNAAKGGGMVTRSSLSLLSEDQATFTLQDVTIGVAFHWERQEAQTFAGNLRMLALGDGTLTALNDIALEDYLSSVISSEMSASAPMALLEAHAIISRSWLVTMLKREPAPPPATTPSSSENEHIVWYGREEHRFFDVCADDHCQRYQGLTRSIPERTAAAVNATRGLFLVYGDEVCDARYYKCCGGRTETFENTWKEIPHPYLTSIADAAVEHPPILDEEAAQRWLLSSPEAWCNTRDEKLLAQILPSFDQETKDFFRWQVAYDQEELGEILREKSGIDFGQIQDLIPLERGPSGRIVRLKIVGTKTSMVVGKELEIRRWLSRSHLYSSAFVVEAQRDPSGTDCRFVLHGGGWGHGVGLCQIGAAVMASQGISAEEILQHYFRGASLKKLY
ncbi:MAG: Stage II sporulation protein [Syntrophus sp. PtaU1.Bin208]|nr:MAG: Stage II sporulation protein [Syntrophus sp. PtaU1.Bin208]